MRRSAGRVLLVLGLLAGRRCRVRFGLVGLASVTIVIAHLARGSRFLVGNFLV